MTTPLQVARVLITRADGKILLARRSQQTVLAGMWELAGGKVDPGETHEQAAVREAREELGIDVALAERLLTSRDIWRDAPIHTQIYLGEAAADAAITLNPREHDDYAWFSLHDLPLYKLTSSADEAVQVLSTKRNLHNILD